MNSHWTLWLRFGATVKDHAVRVIDVFPLGCSGRKDPTTGIYEPYDPALWAATMAWWRARYESLGDAAYWAGPWAWRNTYDHEEWCQVMNIKSQEESPAWHEHGEPCRFGTWDPIMGVFRAHRIQVCPRNERGQGGHWMLVPIDQEA